MTQALKSRRSQATALDVETSSINRRVAAIDWPHVTASLDADGFAVIPHLLDVDERRAVAALYPDDAAFRSQIHMARHGFGRGEYKYFAHPLPGLIAEMRSALYPFLAEIGNRWNEALGESTRFPAEHAASSATRSPPTTGVFASTGPCDNDLTPVPLDSSMST